MRILQSTSLGAFLISGLLLQPVYAQSTPTDEVVVLGSRLKPRSVTETPAPVDFLSREGLTDTAYNETGRAVQALAPSFNFPSTSIADGTDALKPATLRGLGPDQTLVLVNGLRRHKSALVHVNSSVGRGTAGTDMNAIPTSFLQNVEILRDAASALYGSDAIGGVINLQLRRESPGEAIISYGETTEGDGETEQVSLNYGFDWGDDGFVFVGFDGRDHGKTNRAGLSGSRLYGSPEATCNAQNNSGCHQSEFTANRDNFNVGDPESQHMAGLIHAGQRFGRVDVSAFVMASARDNQSTGFFREPDDESRNVAAIYPDGFLPEINTDIADSSLGLIIDFMISDWDAKLAYGSGENKFDFDITNSLNASYGADSPTSADSGGLSYAENVLDFDFSHEAESFGLAFGLQAKQETYEIRAGEQLSYAHCRQIPGLLGGDSSPCENDNAGGIQVFPGFKPDNALSRDRDSLAAFAEMSVGSSAALLSLAARYEEYDGFDSVVNGKLGLRFNLDDSHALRGTVSNGFRAPSMHQLYFNNVSTQFVDDVAQETITARNDSPLAKDLGIPDLTEETSVNVGLGYVFTPANAFSITLDAYQIDITDRIILSNQVARDNAALSKNAQQTFEKFRATQAQFFINGPDTQTRGVELVAEWQPDIGTGELTAKLAGSWTQTEVTGSFDPPGLLDSLTAADLFGQRDRDIIESWQPKSRVTLSGDWQIGSVKLYAAVNRYGTYISSDGSGSKYKRQIISASEIFDARVHWDVSDTLRLTLRGDNIFDTYPDENTIAASRAGTILGIVDSPNGVFRYSRNTAPYGFNGAFWGIKLKARF